MASSFGAELRRRRGEAGLSLDQLAKRIHYNKGYLSKIENGNRRPSDELARQCDAALEANGGLSSLARQHPATDTADTPGIPDVAESWALYHEPDQTRFVSLRKDGNLGQVPTIISEVGSRAMLSESGLASFLHILVECRRLGHSTGPPVLLPGLISHTRSLMNLAQQARQPMHSQLMELAGRYAEYTGWLTQEAGDDRASLWWTDLAAGLAQHTDDHDMAAQALIRRALISMYREDGQLTVALASRAQRDGWVSPRIRGLAAQREAQGHALLGDLSNCQRALDQAEKLLAVSEPADGQLVLGPTIRHHPVQATLGWCMLDLGRPAQSAALLDTAIAGIPATASRSLVRYGARRALAYAMTEEIDHACALTADLMGPAEQVDSATIRAELRSLRRALSRWPSRDLVREVTTRLACALT